MTEAQTPDVEGFLHQLNAYRSSLSEAHQKLLDAMVAAALGSKQEEDEVKPYWVAYHNPVGPAGGVGYGTTVYTPYGAAGWRATPWGGAYGVVYY